MPFQKLFSFVPPDKAYLLLCSVNPLRATGPDMSDGILTNTSQKMCRTPDLLSFCDSQEEELCLSFSSSFSPTPSQLTPADLMIAQINHHAGTFWSLDRLPPASSSHFIVLPISYRSATAYATSLLPALIDTRVFHLCFTKQVSVVVCKVLNKSVSFWRASRNLTTVAHRCSSTAFIQFSLEYSSYGHVSYVHSLSSANSQRLQFLRKQARKITHFGYSMLPPPPRLQSVVDTTLFSLTPNFSTSLCLVLTFLSSAWLIGSCLLSHLTTPGGVVNLNGIL